MVPLVIAYPIAALGFSEVAILANARLADSGPAILAVLLCVVKGNG